MDCRFKSFYLFISLNLKSVIFIILIILFNLQLVKEQVPMTQLLKTWGGGEGYI